MTLAQFAHGASDVGSFFLNLFIAGGIVGTVLLVLLWPVWLAFGCLILL